MSLKKASVSCWNNFPSANATLRRPEKQRDLKPERHGSTLARGLGRSYGDAALNKDNTILLMERMNRMLSFDEQQGTLRAEAGATLAEIIDIFLPRGWFLPVTPGTKYATLGGCFAADVHGKNHHVDGSFSNHVKEIVLILADGSSKRCLPEDNSDLFWATAGGMGLTGIISEVTLQLVPIETTSVNVSHHVALNIGHMLELLNDPQLDDKYSVGWIDCLASGDNLGRGILMQGHHASLDEVAGKVKDPLRIMSPKSISIPFHLPSRTLNYWSLKAFNALYYKIQSRKQEFLTDTNSFFYPLDSLNNWNRIYGRSGFLQYQCVVPTKNANHAMRRLLGELAKNRLGSFLAVIKRFGSEGKGMLSFPKEGITLALDFPLYDPKIFKVLNKLDEIVLKNEGRVYLAKDARLDRRTFQKMYPRYNEWIDIKKAVDPNHSFSSSLGRRLIS